ncbi:MAG TPA: cysteine desulfurase NifS [Candidatus Binatia bacterium]|jgi:cysteine desulfurase|nr:cysteine desulfurase NifS [Candidatus Binatia bacterium]
MNPVVYFDNNATTRLLPEAFEAMRPYLTELYGNPSSIHRFGSGVARKIQEARERIAALLGAADPIEIIFTSGGTEGDNAAVRGILESCPEKRHIVTTRVEHPAILGLCQHLEKKGYRVTWLNVDKDGLLDLDQLRESLTAETALVTIMYANNETGVIFPIKEIGEVVKAKGIPFHVDGVQVAGKMALNLKESPIDLLTVSGHKFHGPKGVGAIYVRRGITFRPFILGGHQERNRRAGTENVAAIMGMGKAAEVALSSMGEDEPRVQRLRDQLEHSLLSSCPDSRINGHREGRLPNTLNISFKFLEGEAILVLLDQQGICASTGSACTAGSVEPSHVLRAMEVPPDWIQGAVRFSLSRYNTEEEVKFVGDKMPGIIHRLLELSAVGKLGDQPEYPRRDRATGNIGARR